MLTKELIGEIVDASHGLAKSTIPSSSSSANIVNDVEYLTNMEYSNEDNAPEFCDRKS
jgi:hypothetical protein